MREAAPARSFSSPPSRSLLLIRTPFFGIRSQVSVTLGAAQSHRYAPAPAEVLAHLQPSPGRSGAAAAASPPLWSGLMWRPRKCGGQGGGGGRPPRRAGRRRLFNGSRGRELRRGQVRRRLLGVAGRRRPGREFEG